MTSSYRAMCAELAEQLNDALDFTVSSETRQYMKSLIKRAHVQLAQPEPGEPTDNKLMDIARATDLVYYMGEGCGFASPYMEETDITAEVLAFAREVLARYGGSTSSSIKA